MGENGPVETAIPLAFTASWASGINPYLLVLMMGLLGRFAGVDVPPAFERVDVLLVFAVLTVVDAVADKIMLVDSGWDTFTVIPGGRRSHRHPHRLAVRRPAVAAIARRAAPSPS